ncbi:MULTISPECIES: energy transducer TonB [unclassified Spirosoma]|uniref:energy transducer TonB n=1 Tax=unclassified Spirosoma TaxID=2621999 RepID=UPI000969ED37|nr:MULTISPECIES: energy transducer TonB [unclassified Spirosoma]MBN8823553.1 TonB family protein [Spirosoma sp.]OJW71842.1 MAG: energy transducer TonB [Spirosoma sp. 48-14]
MRRSDPFLPVAPTYDDIIFQARNQAYGAFVLRQQYRPTLSRALGLGVGLFLAGLAGPALYDHFWPKQTASDQEVMISADMMKLPEKIEEPPVTLPKTEPAPAVNTVRNLPPEVKPEEEVIDENLPPTTDQLKDATSGTETAEGTGAEEVILAPEASAPTIQEKAVEVEAAPEAPFLRVEQQPEYPGGMEALRSFLSKNLNYPRAAASAGVSGRVYVSFVVNTDGSLAELQVLKGIGFGCDEEAIRVMQKMPPWKPGKQSGRAVRVRFNLPISFTLE